jgi:choline dehydrogenase-like flavoprotein
MAYIPVIDLFGSEESSVLKGLVAKYANDYNGELSEGQKIQARHLASVLTDPKDSTCFYSATPVEVYPMHSPQGVNLMSVALALVHPFSRGSIHIQSADPTKAPKIDPKYLSHPLDLEVFARHLLYINRIIDTEPLASMLKPDGKSTLPNGRLRTLDEAKEWAKEKSATQWHACGTCAMMPKELGGVVNDRLVVHGTKNLRVVDASIFPILPKGPITSSVYAVAERAADIIKEDL